MQHISLCEDRQLLEAYIGSMKHAGLESQSAFRQIVERHGRWVFAAAYRQLQDRQLAEDAAQVVFILLARRASAMHGSKLSGWLFNTLQYTVRNMKRMRQRRIKYEQQSAAGRSDAAPLSQESISDLALRLDAAVNRLSSADRTAILLRFYQDCSFEQIGATLGITEEAARKRVTRAVTCLRQILGPQSDAAALSAGAAMGLGLVPGHLMHTLTTIALGAKAGVVLPLTLTAATKGTWWLMTLTKIQIAAAITGASLVVAVPATVAAVRLVSHAPAGPALEPVPVAADAPADAGDEGADLAQFNRIYSLKPDEVIKRINTPFPECRKAGYRSLAGSSGRVPQMVLMRSAGNEPARGQTAPAEGGPATNPGGAVNVAIGPEATNGPVTVQVVPGTGSAGGAPMTVRTGGGGSFRGVPGGQGPRQTATAESLPSGLILRYQENRPLRVEYTLGGVPFHLSSVVQQILAVAPEALEGNKDLLDRVMDGDFVIRTGAPEDMVRAGLEKIFTDQLGVSVTLTFKDVDAPVYVLKGKWDYHPVDAPDPTGQRGPANVPVVHLYSVNTQRSYGNGSASSPDPNRNPGFKAALARKLKTTVVVEAEGIPANLQFSLDDNPTLVSDGKAILDHLTEQTGLAWSQETRKVRHLAVEVVTP